MKVFKRKHYKRLALFLSVLMSFTVLTVVTQATTASIEVFFGASTSDFSEFLPDTIEVRDGLAEDYGYTVAEKDHNDIPIADPTVFDALVAAHIEKYGSSFNKETCTDYLEISSGMISKAFGKSAASSGFMVNDYTLNDGIPSTYGFTGYAVDTARLIDGDRIAYFFYQDTGSWGDIYTHFTETSKTVKANEEVELTLKGSSTFSRMTTSSSIDLPIAGGELLTIVPVNEDGSFGSAFEGKTTDASGKVHLSFNKAGTYLISASGFTEDGNPIIPPYCKITVEGKVPLKGLWFWKEQLTPAFTEGNTEYALPQLSYNQDFIKVNGSTDYEEDASTTSIKYTNSLNKEILETINFKQGTTLSNLRTGQTDLSVQVAHSSGRDENYKVSIIREAALKSLSLQQDNKELALDKTFSATATEYQGEVKLGKNLIITPVAYDADGSEINVNGDPLVNGKAEVAIKEGENPLKIEVAGKNGKGLKTYNITLSTEKLACAKFTVAPSDAVLCIYDETGNRVEPDTNKTNQFSRLVKGKTYTYNLSKAGYITKHESFTAEDKEFSITLQQAAASTLQDVGSEWASYRGDSSNMGITGSRTARTSSEAELKWAKKMGSGWSENPSVQIIVDDAIVTMVGKKLYKLSKETGEIIQQADMVAAPNWGYTPPIYAEGMIIAPLSGGILQAFDAKTLTPLWVSEAFGGQALSPLAYSEGYIYTGFWNAETKIGHFVCISLTDEDQTATNEMKYATWKEPTLGGYYGVGPYITGDYVIYPSDNGVSDYKSTGGYLYSRNKYTGDLVAKESIYGDGRSCIAYDKISNRIYFTTKASYLYSVKIKEDGTFEGMKYKNYGSQSTSTPVVYNGRVYFGLGGLGSAGAAIIVADAETLEEIYRVPMTAYPQCSLLLSNYYEASTGKIYLYATYNKTPGGITVIEDSKGQTEPIYSELFTPEDSLKNYCITSIICDKDGTLYYKNDSSNIFAIAPKQVPNCSVTFNVQPEGATIEVKDSKEQVVAPVAANSYVLEAGSYTYTISKEGYSTQTKTFNVLAEEVEMGIPKTVIITLVPSEGPSKPLPTQNITVTFTLKGDTKHGEGGTTHIYKKDGSSLPTWIDKTTVSVPKGSVVFDVFDKVLTEKGIAYDEPQSGYIGSIKSPGGQWLSEFDNGNYSGWMYTINGSYPNIGFRNYTLNDWDDIVWHYTDDHRYEEDSESWEPSAGGGVGGTLGENNVQIELTGISNGEGISEVKLFSTEVDALIKKIEKQLEKQETKEEPKAVLKVNVSKETAGLVLTIPKQVLDTLNKESKTELEIQSDIGTLSLNPKALESLAKAAGNQDIKISIEKVNQVPKESLTAAEARGTYELTIKAGNEIISSFGKGEVLVALPYTPQEGEDTERLTVYYIGEKGKSTEMESAQYDLDKKCMIFSTPHFSTFAIAYKAEKEQEAQTSIAISFTDVPQGNWAEEAIYYLAQKGLISGKTKTTFSPETAITRGEFIALLARMSQEEMPEAKGIFQDVKGTDWFARNVVWGVTAGITKGTSEVSFEPYAYITRQDMAVMLMQYMNYKQFSLEKKKEAVTFRDEKEIAEYAKLAVSNMQQAGILQGKGNNSFVPLAPATRAEVAYMLTQVIKEQEK